MQDPTLIEKADYVFIESTYGDRLHENVELREDTLAKVVQQTFDKGGRLLIPSFAVERTQELLYYFNRMANAGKFPRQKIFLDSPLAIKATELFKKYVRYYDDDARKTYQTFLSPEYLECLSKNTDSQRLNNYTDPCIVIAGNGMCSGGRIMHHLKHGLWKKENTLLFV